MDMNVSQNELGKLMGRYVDQTQQVGDENDLMVLGLHSGGPWQKM